MSISVAIIGIDGIVLAADSRVTSKSANAEMVLYHNAGKKLSLRKISNELKIGIASVNDNKGFDEWLLDDYFNSQYKAVKDKISNFSDFVLSFSGFIKHMVELYVKDMPDKFVTREGFNLGYTIVGYKSQNDPQIHFLQSSHSFSPDIKRDYYIAGIPSIGDYWMMKMWRQLFGDKIDKPTPKIKVEILKKIAVMLISETSKLNNSVGGKISMVVLNSDGTAYRVNQQELKSIEKYTAIIMDEGRLLNSMVGE